MTKFLLVLLACSTPETTTKIEIVEKTQVEVAPKDKISKGEKLYKNSGCRACHLNPGTGAPDITKIREDGKIAGVLDITAENMKAYLVAPQDYVQGSIMPPTRLKGKKLDDLANYLLNEI